MCIALNWYEGGQCSVPVHFVAIWNLSFHQYASILSGCEKYGEVPCYEIYPTSFGDMAKRKNTSSPLKMEYEIVTGTLFVTSEPCFTFSRLLFKGLTTAFYEKESQDVVSEV
jgi:hypothetical protein